MSTTSSKSLRSFGNPCRSPPSTPSRFGFFVTGVDMLSRNISDGANFFGSTSALFSCELRRRSSVPNVNRKIFSGTASPSASTLMSYLASVAHG